MHACVRVREGGRLVWERGERHRCEGNEQVRGERIKGEGRGGQRKGK